MKCEKICIVEIMCAASGIVKRGSAYGNDVFGIELPVDVLKTVAGGIGMLQQNSSEIPLT